MTGILNLLIISVSLALDAFSVSVAGGIKTQHARLQDAAKVAGFFGVFQAGMPLIGWAVGVGISDLIDGYTKWIAFFILTAVGLKMLKEAFENEEERERTDILQIRTLTMLAVATSIDALVVGFTLNLLNVPVIISVTTIGIITFGLSFAGFVFGKHLGRFFEGKVEIFGAIALIAIGIKLLLS